MDSQMELEPMLATKKKPKTNGNGDKKEKTNGNGSDSDSSGEENGTVRTHRISTTLRPRITGFTPSPRVSTTSQPVGKFKLLLTYKYIKIWLVYTPINTY